MRCSDFLSFPKITESQGAEGNLSSCCLKLLESRPAAPQHTGGEVGVTGARFGAHRGLVLPCSTLTPPQNRALVHDRNWSLVPDRCGHLSLPAPPLQAPALFCSAGAKLRSAAPPHLQHLKGHGKPVFHACGTGHDRSLVTEADPQPPACPFVAGASLSSCARALGASAAC